MHMNTVNMLINYPCFGNLGTSYVRRNRLSHAFLLYNYLYLDAMAFPTFLWRFMLVNSCPVYYYKLYYWYFTITRCIMYWYKCNIDLFDYFRWFLEHCASGISSAWTLPAEMSHKPKMIIYKAPGEGGRGFFTSGFIFLNLQIKTCKFFAEVLKICRSTNLS